MALPIFLFFFLAVVLSYCNFHSPNKRLGLYILLGIGLICVATFKDGSVLRDYQGFSNSIEGSKYADLDMKEPAFFAIQWITSFFPDSQILLALFLYALFGITTKLIAIRQLTEFWFVALAVYISYYFMNQDMVQIRAGVASGFLLLCIKPIYERNGKRFLLFALAAFLFHYSAIVIFPLWFLPAKGFKKGFWLSLIPIAYILYFAHFDLVTLASYIPISAIQAKLKAYQKLAEIGWDDWDFNPLGYTHLAKIFFSYFVLLNINKLQKRNKYTYVLTKIYILSLVIYLLFANTPTIAHRTRDVLAIVEVVLLPSITYIGVPRFVGKLVPITYALFSSLRTFRIIFIP